MKSERPQDRPLRTPENWCVMGRLCDFAGIRFLTVRPHECFLGGAHRCRTRPAGRSRQQTLGIRSQTRVRANHHAVDADGADRLEPPASCRDSCRPALVRHGEKDTSRRVAASAGRIETLAGAACRSLTRKSESVKRARARSLTRSARASTPSAKTGSRRCGHRGRRLRPATRATPGSPSRGGASSISTSSAWSGASSPWRRTRTAPSAASGRERRTDHPDDGRDVLIIGPVTPAGPYPGRGFPSPRMRFAAPV